MKAKDLHSMIGETINRGAKRMVSEWRWTLVGGVFGTTIGAIYGNLAILAGNDEETAQAVIYWATAVILFLLLPTVFSIMGSRD